MAFQAPETLRSGTIEAIAAATTSLRALRRRARELQEEALLLKHAASARLSHLELEVFAAEVRAEEAEARADDTAECLQRVRRAVVTLGDAESRGIPSR